MPELPEVETIVRGLRGIISGYIIKDVLVRESKIIAYPEPVEFIEKLRGKKIKDVLRRGKYIIICFDQNLNLVIHLRMTGRLLIKPPEEPMDKHTHVVFKLDNQLDLRFHNVRKFGRMYLVKDRNWKQAGGLATLGPEPLDDDFTSQEFWNRLSGRKPNLKALLLNQNFIAGLGNIYVDEALFRAGISPKRQADSLNKQEIEELYNAIRKVLKLGIKHGGTSFSDYLNARGEKGNYQNELKVYQREGQECSRCKGQIIKEKIAGRGSHYCPSCQK